MSIEVNPRSLKNLEQICEVLYCLHPNVLDYMINILIDDNEILLGEYNLNKPNFKERESLLKLSNFKTKKVNWDANGNIYYTELEDSFYEEPKKEDKDRLPFKEIVNMIHGDGDYPDKEFVFKRLLKYLQLDTYEYIPIKINVEVEDPVVRKKVRKLINYLEKTNAPEQIYLHKREVDCYAYFAEGYGLTMNEDQQKQKKELLDSRDPERLKKLLIKENLYYY